MWDETRTCGNCLFFKANKKQEDGKTVFGQCRRHAPSPMMREIQESTYSYFPEMTAEEWCGEHRKPPRNYW